MANLIALLTGLEEKRQKVKADREQEERDWDQLQTQKDEEELSRSRSNRYMHTTTDTHSHIHDVGVAPFHIGHNNDKFLPQEGSVSTDAQAHYKADHGGEVYLLKLIHGLYEDCEGGKSEEGGGFSDKAASPPRTVGVAGMGMRIDHLCEALSCCACSIEDELRLQQLVNQLVVQVCLFVEVFNLQTLILQVLCISAVCLI